MKLFFYIKLILLLCFIYLSLYSKIFILFALPQETFQSRQEYSLFFDAFQPFHLEISNPPSYFWFSNQNISFDFSNLKYYKITIGKNLYNENFIGFSQDSKYSPNIDPPIEYFSDRNLQDKNIIIEFIYLLHQIDSRYIIDLFKFYSLEYQLLLTSSPIIHLSPELPYSKIEHYEDDGELFHEEHYFLLIQDKYVTDMIFAQYAIILFERLQNNALGPRIYEHNEFYPDIPATTLLKQSSNLLKKINESYTNYVQKNYANQCLYSEIQFWQRCFMTWWRPTQRKKNLYGFLASNRTELIKYYPIVGKVFQFLYIDSNRYYNSSPYHISYNQSRTHHWQYPISWKDFPNHVLQGDLICSKISITSYLHTNHFHKIRLQKAEKNIMIQNVMLYTPIYLFFSYIFFRYSCLTNLYIKPLPAESRNFN